MNPLTTTDVRLHILGTAQAIIAGKGFAAVGLNEILKAANVPKGSFYHYFSSKESFGEALLENYFCGYMEQLESLLTGSLTSSAERLMSYWEHWLETQSTCDPQSKCLAVKLAAEISDLSEPMRLVLLQSTDRVIARLVDAINDGIVDKSLPTHLDAQSTATMLYQLWLGASLRAKITRDRIPLEDARNATRHLLEQPTPLEKNTYRAKVLSEK